MSYNPTLIGLVLAVLRLFLLLVAIITMLVCYKNALATADLRCLLDVESVVALFVSAMEQTKSTL